MEVARNCKVFLSTKQWFVRLARLIHLTCVSRSRKSGSAVLIRSFLFVSLLPGTYGNTVQLRTNALGMSFGKIAHAYQYHVDFEPEIQSIKLKRSLVNRSRDIHKGWYIPHTTLYSITLFTDPETDVSLLSLRSFI